MTLCPVVMDTMQTTVVPCIKLLIIHGIIAFVFSLIAVESVITQIGIE